MSTGENTKDRVLLILIATVAVVTIFAGLSYLWEQREFRRLVCKVSQRNYCVNVFPTHEERKEWARENPDISY